MYLSLCVCACSSCVRRYQCEARPPFLSVSVRSSGVVVLVSAAAIDICGCRSRGRQDTVVNVLFGLGCRNSDERTGRDGSKRRGQKGRERALSGSRPAALLSGKREREGKGVYCGERGKEKESRTAVSSAGTLRQTREFDGVLRAGMASSQPFVFQVSSYRIQ